jgi:DNA polymerase I-like protein with 3'-5' exonuclease and polymerase domains
VAVNDLNALNWFLYGSGRVEFGWDLETNVVHDFFWRRCRTMQFGNTTEQYLVDLLWLCDGDSDLLYAAQGNYGANLYLAPKLQAFIELVRPALCGREHLKIGVNLGFEYTLMYWNFGLRTQNFFDCSVVERVIYAGAHGLKDYPFYSMEGLMGRYFGVQIDKTLQSSFNLTDPLTQEQIEYAALDTRLPFGVKKVQVLILKGHTVETAPQYLTHIDPLVLGDDLQRTAQLENDAIGAFQDMHIHGERIDRDKWNARVSGKEDELKHLLACLDLEFVKYVGSKSEQVTQEEVDELHDAWKALTVQSEGEVQLKAHIAKYRREYPVIADSYRIDLLLAQTNRKAEKDRLKAIWSPKSKHLTKVRELSSQCQGDALINYGSGAQLLPILNEHWPEIRRKLGKDRRTGEYKKLENLEDETLEAMKEFPVMAMIQAYHKVSKEINTYGYAWTMEWIGQDRPSKEHGWLHPGDGRLHSLFNQYDAETGRSSSSQPNGQNIPKDKEVRKCFIADPGMVLVTADMSGAELRILAEQSGEAIWIDAFNRGEDVHCICCELMHTELWPTLALPGCDGRRKCKCPGHNKLRDEMKPTNFGLPYGISAGALCLQIGKSKQETAKLMRKHQAAFPTVWDYLDDSGSRADAYKKAFDMFGRRRLFPKPEWGRAKLNAMEYMKENLRYPEEDQIRNLTNFISVHGKKPSPEQKWLLNHRLPTNDEINDSLKQMHRSIERQGKNHEIQGTNASIAKVAMGSGHSIDGQPYLWHTLGQYNARLVKFVHDELVVQCPEHAGEAVAALIGDAFKRAGAEVMTKVVMEFEYHIEEYWCK